MSAIPGTVIPLGTVIGPAGKRGPTGLQGAPGPRGAQGADGDEGLEGDRNLPTAIMLPFGGQILPEGGWLWCNGALYNTIAYPNLFAIIGHSFGGSGGQFAVPDTRARALVGVGGLDSDPAWRWQLGQKYGFPRVALSAAQIASHQHGVDINHNHTVGVNNHSHAFAQGWHDHGPHEHNVYGLGAIDCVNTSYNAKQDYYDPLAWHPVMYETTLGPTWASGTIHATGNMGGWAGYVSEVAANWHLRNTVGKGNNQGHENCQPGLGTNFIIKT